MFWNFCLANGYFTPASFIQYFPNTMELIPQHQSLEISEKSQKNLLNLTAQDHLTAGYQNKKKLWNEDQDGKLKKLRENDNLQWEQIAAHLPGRNAKMCYSRYKRLEFHSRDQWKKTEDQILLTLVSKQGENWDEISKHFKKRSAKQIKEHYINYLRPDINKQEWTLEEDVHLTNLLNLYGKNWKQIEELMNGRTQNQIKNRYFGRLRKIQDKKNIQKQNPQTTTSL